MQRFRHFLFSKLNESFLHHHFLPALDFFLILNMKSYVCDCISVMMASKCKSNWRRFLMYITYKTRKVKEFWNYVVKSRGSSWKVVRLPYENGKLIPWKGNRCNRLKSGETVNSIFASNVVLRSERQLTWSNICEAICSRYFTSLSASCYICFPHTHSEFYKS